MLDENLSKDDRDNEDDRTFRDKPDPPNSKEHETPTPDSRSQRASGTSENKDRQARSTESSELMGNRPSQGDYYGLLDKKENSGRSYLLGENNKLTDVFSGADKVSPELRPGERSSGWFGRDIAGSPLLGLAAEMALGIYDLASNWLELQTKRSDKQAWSQNPNLDKYYHCTGHCQATGRGLGGIAVSQVAAWGAEALDFVGKQVNLGWTAQKAFNDCRDDMMANFHGEGLGLRGYSGTRCEQPCLTYSKKAK